MSGHVERLEAMLDSYPDRFLSAEEGDLRAVVDELKQARAEREAWLNGASQRLRHAYRSGWDDRACTVLAALAGGGFMEAEERAAAYAAEWWDRGAALAAEIAAGAQQSERGGEAGT